jgi:hypothetical protein
MDVDNPLIGIVGRNGRMGTWLMALLMDNPNAMACIHQYEKSVNYLNCMAKDGKRVLLNAFLSRFKRHLMDIEKINRVNEK